MEMVERAETDSFLFLFNALRIAEDVVSVDISRGRRMGGD